MKLFGLDFPNIAMKFCEKKEYAEAISKGIIYMKESGYFRKLEDTYRGDPVDGKCPIDLEGQIGAIESADGERIEFIIGKDFVFGFVKDDKIPIFCATLLDETILEMKEKISENKYIVAFRPEFKEGIKDFGEYIVLFNLDDFLNKADEYLKKHHIMAKSAKVEYVDIMKQYNEQMLDDKRDQYLPFFKKHITYKWQNEWRMVLIDHEHKLIKDDCDYYVMELGELYQAQVVGIDFISNDEITLSVGKQNND